MSATSTLEKSSVAMDSIFGKGPTKKNERILLVSYGAPAEREDANPLPQSLFWGSGATGDLVASQNQTNNQTNTSSETTAGPSTARAGKSGLREMVMGADFNEFGEEQNKTGTLLRHGQEFGLKKCNAPLHISVPAKKGSATVSVSGVTMAYKVGATVPQDRFPEDASSPKSDTDGTTSLRKNSDPHPVAALNPAPHSVVPNKFGQKQRPHSADSFRAKPAAAISEAFRSTKEKKLKHTSGGTPVYIPKPPDKQGDSRAFSNGPEAMPRPTSAATGRVRISSARPAKKASDLLNCDWEDVYENNGLPRKVSVQQRLAYQQLSGNATATSKTTHLRGVKTHHKNALAELPRTPTLTERLALKRLRAQKNWAGTSTSNQIQVFSNPDQMPSYPPSFQEPSSLDPSKETSLVHRQDLPNQTAARPMSASVMVSHHHKQPTSHPGYQSCSGVGNQAFRPRG
ncbi:hypothetical protein CYMTET_29360 [Cymbomonas tetramitiformis]|uniref:Uncharacterized protein n=1 Tax=Cymbomonas tetramitiformis TaxID=36881 RepID=A0AAE0FLE7_9CHLO|nr:hypothetical protein CYMTET_29360 [Cymbomonas tetramitiformis]